jgi:hypothetical protein
MARKVAATYLVNRKEMKRIIHSHGFKCGKELYAAFDKKIRGMVDDICQHHAGATAKVNGEHPPQPVLPV